MAMGKNVPIHIVPILAAPNADMTAAQTAERLSVPGAVGAAGTNERLPCMHSNYTLMNFATCHLTI